jgi:hypothetical protein
MTGTSWAGGVGVGEGDCARQLKTIARIANCQRLRIENLWGKRIWLNEINFGDFWQSWQFWQSTTFVRVSAVKP